MSDTELILSEKEDPTFAPVPLIRTDDDVLGGLNGALNRPSIALAERTEYLHKNMVEKSGTARLMTADEGTKLAGIETGAQVNPGAATTSAAGLMSPGDKTKLDGIAGGATANVKGTATPKPLGTAAAGASTDYASAEHVHANEVPTQGVNDSSTKIANTAFVNSLLLARRPIGKVEEWLIEPTSAELIKWRLLPLDGKAYLITDYQDLFNRKYVGDGANQTALAWYRCNTPSNPDGSRSTAGAYFVTADARGIALRGWGQNLTKNFRRADDTPYDGMSIGAMITDAMQNVTGEFSTVWGSNVTNPFYYKAGRSDKGKAGEDLGFATFGFDLSRSARTASETRPATMSVWRGITF
jgi:hypothetical protein